MLGKSKDQNQKNLFQALLKELINPNHELAVLADQIAWEDLEKEFAPLYSNVGTPSKPVRLMTGLLILKQLYDLGDETVVAAWIQNPYFQYFCGEAHFQWTQPCDPSDLVHFRKRIAEKGVERILAESVRLHGKDAKSSNVLVDTTVQEKNITYPTDVKLQKKIIDKCKAIANKEHIELRQTYTRTVRKLMIEQHFAHHPKRAKKARAAQRKLKTLAGRVLRDVSRKLEQQGNYERYKEQLGLYARVLAQKRVDKNKIYSLHEPGVACIAKGKAHKKYEFGSKVSFAVIPKSNVIVAAVNFQGNPHDSQTIESTLARAESNSGNKFKNAIVDRGYRGRKKINHTNIILPDNGKLKAQTPYQRRKKRMQCRSRAAIEPVIGHIKHDHRMIRNYLKGTEGDQINAILAAAAFNFKGLLNKIKKAILWPVFYLTEIGILFRQGRFYLVGI